MSQAMPMPETSIQEAPIEGREMPTAESLEQTALRVAAMKFHGATDWVTFFREVMGVDGVLRKVFLRPEDLLAFEKSDEYAQIQLMLAKLRERRDEPSDDTEPTRVITVRLPKSVHESLKAEAHLRQTSMNKLCISKLLQMIDNDLVPSD